MMIANDLVSMRVKIEHAECSLSHVTSFILEQLWLSHSHRELRRHYDFYRGNWRSEDMLLGRRILEIGCRESQILAALFNSFNNIRIDCE